MDLQFIVGVEQERSKGLLLSRGRSLGHEVNHVLAVSTTGVLCMVFTCAWCQGVAGYPQQVVSEQAWEVTLETRAILV